jgi:hypothetical protein
VHTTDVQGANAVGVDLDPARRPGVPRERTPAPWPNTRFPPSRQPGKPSVPRHGRPGKPMPPVFGTAVPLRGVSGLVRRAAYRTPDHFMRHWMMLLLADRVDAWETRLRRAAKVGLPFGVLALAGAWLLRER